MSVLVIGGTGFIGPRVVRKLVEKAEQFGATPLDAERWCFLHRQSSSVYLKLP